MQDAKAGVWSVVLVFAGSCAGAYLGTLLTFPEVGAAVLFVPYAVLCTALVMSPPRQWWIYLLASTAGNLVPHATHEVELSFVLGAELANHARAAIAALGIRWARARGRDLNDLRGMTFFLLFAAGVGPGVGALLGAADVALHGKSDSFWLTWEEWLLSNVVTAVTLVPLLLAVVNPVRRGELALPRVRVVEALALLVGLVTVGGLVFTFSVPDVDTVLVRMYWPLPFLLWMAVRFSPAGTSAALLVVATLTAFGAFYGKGPFTTGSPTENLLDLQLFLVALSVPLLLLSALVREAKQLAAQSEIAKVLRENDRKKDQFLALLGHELRNPLAPLRMTVELLRHRPASDPDTARAHALIARQVEHMARLVDDLLDVSRITRGTVELRLEDVDLRDVVATALETATPLVAARKHEVVVDRPADPVWVRGDPTRLAQMVGNLVHNAAKYTPPGGRIEVGLRRDGGAAILTVRDNGIGIPPDALERVFELFEQAPSGELGRGGLGIGLTLVRHLARLHDGTVVARSEGIGRGSELVLTLPALATAPAAVAAAPADDATGDPRLDVVVVDDNLDAADTMAQLLGRWGHAVHTVHDGDAALEAVHNLAPDVVVLDLDLPKIDGFEVARRLRRSQTTARIMLVAVSGFGQPHHVARTREVGIDHHLVKPVDVAALRALLRARG
jgi:signal transduction histidine kinase